MRTKLTHIGAENNPQFVRANDKTVIRRSAGVHLDIALFAPDIAL
jgi:hypothetical protein